MAPSAPQI